MKRGIRNVVIFGATSGIAQAVGRILCADQCRFCLVGRNAEKLEIVASDFRVRGGVISACRVLDLNDTDLHAGLITDIATQLGPVDVLVFAQGLLGDQKRAEAYWPDAAEIFSVNLLSVASLLTHASILLEAQGAGQLVVIGSVAGDRGRKTNYVYGAAKAGLETFVEGIRHRLAPAGIGVLLVKPGFVATPMTAHLPPSPLTASPDAVGRAIVKAMNAGKSTIYTPFFWRWIMLVIRLLPERIFNRLSV